MVVVLGGRGREGEREKDGQVLDEKDAEEIH